MRNRVVSLGLCLALAGGAAFASGPGAVTVAISFSDRALATLREKGEGVVVSAYFMGDPIEGASLPLTEIDTIFLQSEEVTLQPGPVTLLLGGNLGNAPVDMVTVPMINVNVFSARWTSEDNLLDCEFLDDAVAVLASAPQKIHCKLIGE